MNREQIAERLKHLSPAKRALFEKLLQQQASAAAPADSSAANSVSGEQPAAAPTAAITPAADATSATSSARAAEAPLSLGQQRLWFLDQLEPGSAFYNVSAAVRLEGPVDIGLLHQALDRAVQRHEALRTRFLSRNGEPYQQVLPHLPPHWHEVDLSSLPAEKREAELQRRAGEEANRPFDLDKGPLVRAVLYRLGPQSQVLLLVLHHIVCDGWSLAVLRYEISALYEALAKGAPDPLPPLRQQYIDYTHWQRERMQSEQLASQLTYWRKRLEGFPPWLELPTDFPRPAVQSFRGATVRLPLSPELSDALKQLARQNQATPFMVLLAAWQLLLARISGNRDIWVGTPVAGRHRREFEPMVGFFVNTLVMRSQIDLNASFHQFLEQVRQNALDDFGHQELPFERLVEAIQPERDLSRTPLFQTMFVLQNAPVASHRLADLTIADVDLGHVQATNFDLTLNVSQGRQFDLLLVYNRDLFLPETAQRLLHAFQTLLESIARGPHRAISDLPLLSTAQRRQQLLEWNAAADRVRGGHVAAVFAEQVARTPHAIAIEDGNVRLTYAELDRRANRVAHYLLSRNIGHEDVVGLCFDRSAELYPALLGVLKAGAAYTPLDPTWPAARLQMMVEDAALRIVLSQSSAAQKLPELVAASPGVETPSEAACADVPQAAADGTPLVICLDQLDELATLPDTPPRAPQEYDPSSLAYIIFTSGSTGRPKGVEVEHAGLVNHAREIIDAAKMGPGDRLLQYLSLSFDAAGEEIFPSLLSGAALVLHPTPLELTGGDLLAWSQHHQVNLLHVPPAVWQQMIEIVERDPAAAGHLRAFLTGGDSVATDLVRRWLKQTGIPMIYLYGVTEATITTTMFVAADADRLPERDRLPIGRPIGGNEVYILDERLQPLPVGVAGELVLAGIGVARGYRRPNGPTTARFIRHPFNARGGRAYRTGDLARFLPDGNIEFIGRVDHQVKIRGYRIELGEIEAALSRHPQVAECVVIAREDQPGRKRLVAYYVLLPQPGQSESSEPAAVPVEELIEHLESRLPAYMIPAAFVPMAKLPREHHGRIARHLLPVPDASRPEMRQAYVPPQTEVERKLAEIWGEVLGLEQVGRHDNFFELGGDSILTIQVIARASAAGLRLTPKQLFLNQTIAELAQVAGTGPEVVAQQGEVVGPTPLTPVQHEFLAQRLANPDHFNQAVMLVPSAELSPSVVATALRRLIIHHDALRLRLTTDGQGATIQYTAPVEQVNLDDLLVRRQAADAAELAAVAAEVQASLSVTTGPLVRAAWIDLAGQSPRLLLAIHHLAVDAVSWRILIEDLQTLCHGLLQSLDVPLPAKTTSFQDWARRLEEEAASPARQQEQAHWLETLRVPGAIPVDHPEGSNRAGDTRRHTVSLTAEETEALLHQVPSAYRTQVHETLLAALAMTLTDWTGFRRWRVDLEGHGRADLDERYDLSRTVGWFTTLYPVQIRAIAPEDPRQMLIDTKELLRAVPDGGLGYGLLRWLHPDAAVRQSLADTPREPAAICFNYLGQFDQSLPPGALFRLADEDAGPLYDAENPRRHIIELLSHIHGGQLHVQWVYSGQQYEQATIEKVAADHLAAVRKLIAHCQAPDAGSFTPSDFPLAELDAEDLESLSALLGDDEGE